MWVTMAPITSLAYVHALVKNSVKLSVCNLLANAANRGSRIRAHAKWSNGHKTMNSHIMHHNAQLLARRLHPFTLFTIKSFIGTWASPPWVVPFYCQKDFWFCGQIPNSPPDASSRQRNPKSGMGIRCWCAIV